MDIEVVYDIMSQPIKRLYRVNNSKQAKLYLDKFVDAALDRGMRLRIVPYNDKGLIEISDRTQLRVDMAEAALRAAGFKPKRIAFLDHNHLRKNMRQKA